MVAVALVAPACGGGSDGASGDDQPASALSTEASGESDSLPGLLEDGVISDAALAAVFDADGQANGDALEAFAAEFSELPLDQQEAAVAALAMRTELEAAAISGLEAAVGGRDATEAALTGAMSQVRAQSDAAVAAVAVPQPEGFRRPQTARIAAPAPSGGTVAAIGLFMGYMALATFGKVVTEASNTIKPDYVEATDDNGKAIVISLEEVDVELTFKGDQDGVDVDFVAGSDDPSVSGTDGTFTMEALIDVKASKGGAGQNAKMELKISGTVDDNAELAESEHREPHAVVRLRRRQGPVHRLHDVGPERRRRVHGQPAGGTVTQEFVNSSAVLSTLVGLMISYQLLDAVEKAWKSGRCVALKVTPSAGPKGSRRRRSSKCSPSRAARSTGHRPVAT